LIDNQDSNARTTFEVALWAFLCGPKIVSIADHFFSSSFSVLELESSFFVKEIFKVKMFINSEGHFWQVSHLSLFFTTYQILMHFYKKLILWSQIDHRWFLLHLTFFILKYPFHQKTFVFDWQHFRLYIL
jgi:hypothetical protein